METWFKLAAALSLLLALTCPALASDTPAKPDACSASEYHQFDFWIGDWDVFDMDKPDEVVARARVEPILNGCVLLEDYQQNDGLRGQSFNHYDASRKTWHESWVTNRGTMLLFDGSMESGAMVLNGVSRKDGQDSLIRDTWKLTNDIVRETAVKSTDGGKTWRTLFDMGFRRHKESAALSGDPKP